MQTKEDSTEVLNPAFTPTSGNCGFYAMKRRFSQEIPQSQRHSTGNLLWSMKYYSMSQGKPVVGQTANLVNLLDFVDT